MTAQTAAATGVLTLGQVSRVEVATLLARYGITLELVPLGGQRPRSYRGDTQAGLREDSLHARLDTPLHSILHEAAHFACMTPERRSGLDTDAGGDTCEENGVCYLQILLATELQCLGRERM